MKAAGAFNGLPRELRDTMTAHIILVSGERTEPHDRRNTHSRFVQPRRTNFGPYGKGATCLTHRKARALFCFCERILPSRRLRRMPSLAYAALRTVQLELEMELFRCSSGDRIGEFL